MSKTSDLTVPQLFLLLDLESGPTPILGNSRPARTLARLGLAKFVGPNAKGRPVYEITDRGKHHIRINLPRQRP